jgi:HEAT repeat protein
MDIFDEDEPSIKEIEELIDSKNIEGLIDSLENTYSFYKKRLIIKELCRIGDNRVIEPFIECLKYEGKQTRGYIVDFLLKKVNEKATKHLINAFNSIDEYYHYRRKDILKVLMQIKEAAVEPLIHSLNNEDHDIKKNAAVILGKIRDERAIEPLIDTLEDRYPSVRMMAAEALKNLPDTRAVKLL